MDEMTGYFSSNRFFDKVLWREASIHGIKIDYDELIIFLNQSNGDNIELVCSGYIGYEFVGFWDEAIVAEARLVISNPFLEKCVKNIASRYPNGVPSSGSESRNLSAPFQLDVVLDDGCILRVAMNDFRLNE